MDQKHELSFKAGTFCTMDGTLCSLDHKLIVEVSEDQANDIIKGILIDAAEDPPTLS
jgi:hypothetical protein